MRQRHLQHGFTILELAIVLAIIALIAGTGLSIASGALKAADRVTTQERLNTIKLAVDGFAKAYGYYPCPANRTLTPSNANFGIERRTGATACDATAVTVGGTYSIGMVPVRTLGLPDNYAADAWSNKLTFAVSNSVVSGPGSFRNPGNLEIRSGSLTTYRKLGVVVNTTSGGTASANGGTVRLTFASNTGAVTGNLVYVNSPSYSGSYTATVSGGGSVVDIAAPYSAADTGVIIGVPTITGGATYAIVSHGPNAQGAVPLSSTAVPSNKSCDAAKVEGENCDNGNNIFFDNAYNDGVNVSLFFDDYVAYGSNELLQTSFYSPYVSTTATTCPAGTCEAWCAACSVNYPGATGAAPPPSITSGVTLCRKVITSNATTCTASCFWGGTTASGYAPCP